MSEPQVYSLENNCVVLKREIHSVWRMKYTVRGVSFYSIEKYVVKSEWSFILVDWEVRGEKWVEFHSTWLGGSGWCIKFHSTQASRTMCEVVGFIYCVRSFVLLNWVALRAISFIPSIEESVLWEVCCVVWAKFHSSWSRRSILSMKFYSLEWEVCCEKCAVRSVRKVSFLLTKKKYTVYEVSFSWPRRTVKGMIW